MLLAAQKRRLGDKIATAAPFDVRTSIELARRGAFDRIAFAVLYAGLSLLIAPWPAVLAWISTILAWELVLAPRLDRFVTKLLEPRASAAFATTNMVGAGLYQCVTLLGLMDGGSIGVAIAATWFSGSVLTTFIHFNANRRLLLATLFPAVMASVIGPALAYGLDWRILIVPALLSMTVLSARRFSLDHNAVLHELANRQVAIGDLERKLSVAIEASGDGLFESDLVADTFHASPAWSAMLGYGPGEVGGQIDWRAFVHPDDQAALAEDYAAHFRGDAPHTTSELRMRCKNGAYKWVLSRARVISRTASGDPWKIVGTTIDISARKALEHDLEAARDLAQNANSAKNVFVANMSHEIRTPLNGVIGIAGALARTALSSGQREMVSLIQSSGQVLERMLSDILDQAKIEAGNFQLQISAFDLREEVDAAASLMRAPADEKGVVLRVEYADAARGVFEGDAVRIRQIISNLASNAIKFTARGDVAIKVAVTDPDQASAPSVIRIEVRDSGIGFDAQVADQLFNRFVQADGSISRQFGGTGLGLAICKALVELMQGQITARSWPGVGSIFTVEIPLARSMTIAALPRQGANAGIPGETAPSISVFATTRILLAEDHPTNQRVVQLILESTGVELTIVNNGQEAVDIFQPGRFDLVLMDMQMPLMDGLAATRAIRAREKALGCSPTPIAMFTANAMDEHRALAIAAGAEHHISKPITPERLLMGIDLALSPGQVERSIRAEA
ncbi:PAS domain S-box [Caulobacter sp. AP07]|uniref:PAS domain-containing hybrid sensor histidine kinase/response regulator n=1 Tax=Caulobacter sp. AP07 TaxID=1144304 RepID=UPI000272118A|nr:PAS domain-containing hybrid sensor histidine kinase/response regulator [Caulobacter sp. AP07]EJL27380.1 PAS domain S-box [Caulobacter sp. AP07]